MVDGGGLEEIGSIVELYMQGVEENENVDMRYHKQTYWNISQHPMYTP